MCNLNENIFALFDTPPRINPGDSRFTDRCPQAGLAQSPRALGSGVSRPTMYNLRQQAQSFVQDILCGIFIFQCLSNAHGVFLFPRDNDTDISCNKSLFLFWNHKFCNIYHVL